MSKKYKWKFEVELEVDPSWVADGFDFANRIEKFEEEFGNILLPYAYTYEVETKVKLLESPSKYSILKEQGYTKKQIQEKIKGEENVNCTK